MIDKEYLPAAVEERWSSRWIELGLFEARPDENRPRFCMVIPPPNITGELHVGHVLVYTLHDIVARWRRMHGDDVLWLPGTDHAGIATQMVVERELAKEGLTRHELGREEFERRIWDWKSLYAGRITDALKRLGASVDWSRERFTLDEGLSRAVRAVFVQLHRDGLIYRGRAIVNWCPRCQTALSDLESVHQPIEGKLYVIRYPWVDGEGGLSVATTRPETLFGDTAVAVHPEDERFGSMVGRQVRVPLTERAVRVVADAFVDPSFGTGVVKITPAHDLNDFQAAKRLGLSELVAIDTSGRMTEAAGAYRGLERLEARARVVTDLECLGLLVATRPHEHAVAHCQRCGTMIEPLASDQWFVRIEPLAQPAIEAVEQGRVRFVPDSWSKTYFEWMRNIHDWCISRQLWWGHRIPAWHCDACASVIVAEDPPGSCGECRGPLRQDPDVLDTWFSSALWPFSTLGWPDRTKDLARYYPTDLLITGHDIIFFWVARMIMLGLRFMDDVPFGEVYIHGLVRDAEGQKMSKSKGNTVDPRELQQRYGTDAVRFTMAALAAPGNDIPLASERMDGSRAFANKLWNASRFVLMRLPPGLPGAYRPEELTLADRWILSRARASVIEVDEALSRRRFDLAANTLYHFAWHQFCDWYIEMVKPRLGTDAEGSGSRSGAVAHAVLLEVLGSLLRMLHPFMPYVTEELWSKLPGGTTCLAGAAWPDARAMLRDDDSEEQVASLQETAVKVRNLRAESNIDPARRIDLLLRVQNPGRLSWIRTERELLATLVRARSVEIVDDFPGSLVAARGATSALELAIPLEGLLDLDLERERLRKDLARVEADLASRSKRLSDPSFLERAPVDIVEKERRVERELLERKARLDESLAGLSRASRSG